MLRSYLLLLAVLVFSDAVTISDFTASFQMTTSDMESRFGVKSYVYGTLTYSWSRSSMKINFKLGQVGDLSQTEFYTFVNNGLNSSAPNQVLYKQFHGVGGCCEVIPLEQDQPYLFASEALRKVNDGNSVTDQNGNVCSHYVPTSTNTVLVDLWVNDNTGFICRADMFYLKGRQTKRSFVFYDVARITPTASTFAYTIPDICACIKPLDVVLVMDRSGSISQKEYLQQQQFLSDFSSQFEFGGNSMDLSIVEFSSAAFPKPLLPLSAGISAGNIQTAIKQFSCCIKPNFDRTKPSNGDSTCCTGYTSISSGLYAAGQQLVTDTNPNTTKIIVIVTDGFHNTLRNDSNYQCYSNKGGKTCDSITDGTLDMYKCVTSSTFAPYRKLCLDDLSSTVNQIRNQVPGVIFFSVFVGQFVPPEEINIITNGDVEKQIQVQDFSRLADFTKVLTQRICTVVGDSCGECCGFCACGVCYPGQCEKNPCRNTTQIDGTQCCRETPYTCPSVTNKCERNYCDVNTDSCINYHNTSTDPCLEANNPCFLYTCDPATGSCLTAARTCDGMAGYNPENKCQKCECQQPDPTDPSTWKLTVTTTSCSGPDLCNDYFCEPTNGQCTFSPKSPPEDDPCKVYCCDPATGNWTSETLATCDKTDLNPCELACSCQTNDPCFEFEKCNPTTGKCEFKPKVCDDNNACTEDTCVDGSCVFADLLKCVNGSNKCITSSCDPASGNCLIETQTCDDGNCCTTDYCVPETGECRHDPVDPEQVCPGSNKCVTWTCMPDLGITASSCCVPIYKECNDDKNCTIDTCDPNYGCVFETIDCYYNLTNNGTEDAPDCNTAICNEEEGGKCEWLAGICPFVIAIPITIGVIVGIVLGIVAFLVLAGGGSYAAITGISGLGGASVVQTNPLYEPSTMSNSNVLYEGGD